MLCRFATLSNLVQSCSVMLRAAQSILKAVKNVQWTRLNFFYLKKMFSRFATPLNIVQFAQARYKCKKGEFRHDGEEMESSASISSMNSRERYAGSNEDSSDKINCNSDDQSDRRERGYDDIDGTNSRPNPRGISLPKISYTFGKNPFVFKKNPAKIRINPFVLKKSRTLFPMSEVPLGLIDLQLFS